MNVHFQSRTSNKFVGVKGNTIGLFGQSKRVRSRRGKLPLAVGREARSPAVPQLSRGGGGVLALALGMELLRRARSRRQLTSAES